MSYIEAIIATVRCRRIKPANATIAHGTQGFSGLVVRLVSHLPTVCGGVSVNGFNNSHSRPACSPSRRPAIIRTSSRNIYISTAQTIRTSGKARIFVV